jgi:hypothetical protein
MENGENEWEHLSQLVEKIRGEIISSSVQSPAVIFQKLEQLILVIEKNNSQTYLFLENYHRPFGVFLFQTVVPNWLPLFSPQKAETIMERYFVLKKHPHKSLFALCEICDFQKHGIERNEETLSLLRNLLQKNLEQNPFSDILPDLSKLGKSNVANSIHALASLPDRLSNLYQKDNPLQFSHQ